MKQSLLLLILLPLLFSVNAQTSYQQELINDINQLTADLNNDPHNVDLLVKRSEAIFKLNASEPGQKWVPFGLHSALTDINTAIEIDSDNPALYAHRAEYKRDINGDYDGAITDMNFAINLDPENSNWYFQRAAYKHYTAGCKDYHQCSMLKDARCAKIVQTVCQ